MFCVKISILSLRRCIHLEPKQPGNKQMPDFDKLNDRIIAESPTGPMLVIKTNLDPQDVTEKNPYYNDKKEVEDPKEFKNYFEE
jgi:hypothetical protein